MVRPAPPGAGHAPGLHEARTSGRAQRRCRTSTVSSSSWSTASKRPNTTAPPRCRHRPQRRAVVGVGEAREVHVRSKGCESAGHVAAGSRFSRSSSHASNSAAARAVARSAWVRSRIPHARATPASIRKREKGPPISAAASHNGRSSRSVKRRSVADALDGHSSRVSTSVRTNERVRAARDPARALALEAAPVLLCS